MSTSNKHPHADLINKWLDDFSTVFEEFDSSSSVAIDPCDVLYDTHGDRQIRVRKVNLIIGHWYPCLDKGYVSVKMRDGEKLITEEGNSGGFNPDSLDDIGESLGKLEF